MAETRKGRWERGRVCTLSGRRGRKNYFFSQSLSGIGASPVTKGARTPVMLVASSHVAPQTTSRSDRDAQKTGIPPGSRRIKGRAGSVSRQRGNGTDNWQSSSTPSTPVSTRLPTCPERAEQRASTLYTPSDEQRGSPSSLPRQHTTRFGSGRHRLLRYRSAVADIAGPFSRILCPRQSPPTHALDTILCRTQQDLTCTSRSSPAYVPETPPRGWRPLHDRGTMPCHYFCCYCLSLATLRTVPGILFKVSNCSGITQKLFCRNQLELSSYVAVSQPTCITLYPT